MQENIACDTVRKKKSTTFNLTAFHINGRMITEVHLCICVFLSFGIYPYGVLYMHFKLCFYNVNCSRKPHVCLHYVRVYDKSCFS